MKKCTDCEKEKDDSEFHKNQHSCKICKSLRHKESYKDNKQFYLDKNAERRKIFRKYAKSLQEGKCCELCGEDDPVTFDYHHKDPSQKDFSISRFFGTQMPSEKNKKLLREEIEKCTILCANCHRKEHAKLLDAA